MTTLSGGGEGRSGSGSRRRQPLQLPKGWTEQTLPYDDEPSAPTDPRPVRRRRAPLPRDTTPGTAATVTTQSGKRARSGRGGKGGTGGERGLTA